MDAQWGSQDWDYQPDTVPGENGAEDDGDQLDQDDTLESSRVEDALDEGHVTRDRDSRDHWGETAWEARHAEPLDARLAQELPDIDDAVRRGQESDRTGRLEAVRDGAGQDSFARDAGVSGGAASSEEAAMHTTTLDDLERVEAREREGLEGYEED